MLVRGGKFVYTRTKDEILKDFEKLCSTPHENMIERNTEWETRTGAPTPNKKYLYRMMRVGQSLAESQHWMHRMQTATRWWPSGQTQLTKWNRDPSHLDAAAKRIQHATRRQFTDEELRYDTVRANSALMTLTHFRASVAKHLCDTEGARTVLDFSAGWGDRLTGFLASASVKTIVLVDPRPGSIAGCRRQHELVNSPKTLELHQDGAESVLPRLLSDAFDLILTSPPYFDMEHYGETPDEAVGQIRNKVGSVEEYVSAFLTPVLTECARVLRPGGLLALNLDDNLRTKTFVCQPALDILDALDVLELVGTAGLRKGTGFGAALQTKTKTKAEPIYLYRRRS